MKTAPLLVLSSFMSFAAFAQTLPDEINYAPYEIRYQTLATDTSNTEADLSNSESDLREARKFIVDMNDHIRSLESDIRGYESEISRLRSEIPSLESQISSLSSQASSTLSDIRNRESQEDSLETSHRNESSRLRPLEDVVARKAQRIRELDAQLQDARRDAREAESRITRAQNEIQQAERIIDSERNQQRDLRVEQGGLENQINQLQAEVSRLESQQNSSEQQLNQERSRLHLLQGQVQQAQNELNNIRAQGPSQAQLQEAQRKLDNAVSNRDRSAAQVSSLGSQISRAESEISRLEGSVSTLQSSISTETAKLGSLNSRVQEYTNELASLRANGGTPEQIKDLERKLGAVTNTRDKTAQEIQSLQSQLNNVQPQISQLRSQLSSLNSQLSSERNRLAGLEQDVNNARRELAAIQSSGPNPEAVREAERKLAQATAERDRSQGQVQNLQNQVAQLQNEVRTKRAAVEMRRRAQASLPQRIATSEAREREAVNLRAARNQELQRFQSELTQSARNAQNIDSALAQAQNEIRGDQQNLERQRNLVENITQQINNVRNELAALTSRHQNLSQQIVNLNAQLADDRASIPNLQNEIKKDQAEIVDGRSEIVKAEADVGQLVTSIAAIEAKLAVLRRDRDAAEVQMDQRATLYQKYLSEAKQLGSGQIQASVASGEKEGQSIAKNISKLQGSAVGKELGIAEAKLWASVRGEIQGYDQGYAQGIASVEDINRGVQEGKDKGKADATVTAQSQFRPQYFEEALISEFKKPMEGEAYKMMSFEVEEEQNFDEIAAVAPLSSAEITRSDALPTPLDASILSFNKDVKVLKEKVISLANPNVVYVAPASVPYGAPVCTAIYKNLAVYKKACEDSYKSSFGDSFFATTRTTFNKLYADLYKVEADSADLSTREAQYPAEMISATAVASAHGQKLGKADIYQQKFTVSYKETYALELPLAKDVAKLNAQDDLVKALETKGLLTLGKSKIAAEDFRGSEELTFTSQVKNISKVAFNGPVLLKITESQNVEFAAKEIVLNSAKAQGFTSFLPVKGKINPSAKTGDKIVIRGTVNLPGDVYKPQRQETFEIIQVLAANPTHSLGLDYLKNPDIKGVFRYNIHALRVNIKPTAEAIAAGYQVTLKAVGENADLIDLNNTEAATGALAQNEQKEVKFTYTFSKAAKGKTITMELSISYAGKVLKKELLVVNPG